MPALSGSDRAYKHARLAVARLGASRLNYYTPIRIGLLINGTDRTAKLIKNSVRITDVKGSQYNTAVLRVEGFTPTAGQEIKISLGAADNLIFAGRIQKVSIVFRSRSVEAVQYDLSCVDYLWDLNRRLVTATYAGASATDVITSIMTTFTSGFTTAHVQNGMAALDQVAFEYRTVSDCFDEIAQRLGATWKVDYTKDLHFYTTDEPTTYLPETLSTSSIWEWRNLKHTTDLSQIRTRVYSEGGTSRLVASRNATSFGALAYNSDGLYRTGVSGNDPYLYVDDWAYGFGTADRLRVDQSLYLPNSAVGAYNSLTQNVAQIATVTNTVTVGATTIPISATTGLPSTSTGGIVQIGHQIIRYSSVTTGGSPSLDGVPASGEGSVVSAIPASPAQDVIRPYVLRLNETHVAQTHQVGASVISVRIRNDASAQAALAALDGSDGVREGFRRDARDSYLGAAASGDADLLELSSPLESITFESRDVNLRSGQVVGVNVGGITNSFTVQRMVIGGLEDASTKFPLRAVEASTRRFDFYDALAEVEKRK